MFKMVREYLNEVGMAEAIRQLGGVRALGYLMFSLFCAIVGTIALLFAGVSCLPYLNVFLIGGAFLLLLVGACSMNEFLYRFSCTVQKEPYRR